MKTKINSKTYSFDPNTTTTAVEVIRDKAQLTGTKLVCGQGVCGACTVLVDGEPIVSCICPSQQLEGKNVKTVEGHASKKLHPVQQAFMACDGLQCGFCTPGFINEGIAFYKNWRAEHGTKKPSRQEIAEAMSGHLCRCGAYGNIYDALQQACTGKFDKGEITEYPRVDAREKVTGDAKYTADIQLEGQLVGKILRSPHAHATVKDKHVEKVKDIKGVKAIIDLLPEDNIVRYIGHEIAAVAATDEKTAEAALKKFNINYDIKSGVANLEDARKDDAPLVWNDGKKNPPNAAEGPIIPGIWEGNVRSPFLSVASKWGMNAHHRVQDAREQEDNKLTLEEGTWRTSAQIHTALEPHVCVADWQADDTLIVYLSSQTVHNMGQAIAQEFDLEESQVEVRCDYIGGAFGAKIGLTQEAIAAIKLSRAAKAPVKVMLSREEEMENGGYRPPAEINLSLVANKKQKLTALRAKAYTNSGIGINSLVATLMRMIYPAPTKDLTDYDVVTNLASGKPFRAPSAPLTCWAIEQAVESIAEQMKIDPIALRKKWDDHKLRQELYNWAADLPVWKNRQATGSQSGRYRKGVGVAMGNWMYMYHSKTKVVVEASTKGIKVSTASQDMGNGTRTVLAKAVAEVLGISRNEVLVEIGKSSLPIGPGSNGSRTTTSVYTPTIEATTKIKEALIELANNRGWEEVRLENGAIVHRAGTQPLGEFLTSIEKPIQAEAKRGTDAFIDFLAMLPMGDTDMGKGSSGAVCVTEVEVDTLLGKTKVLRVWNGLAVGKIIVPQLALSQCYGGIIQGLGYALYEERVVDEATCKLLTLGLEDYKIPGIGDIPEMHIHFLEKGFKHAKGNTIGLSEISKIPIAASIGNAIYNATGWQPKQMPVRPDLLLKGLGSNKKITAKPIAATTV